LSQSDHHSNLLSILDRADVRNSSLEGKTASGDDVKDLVPQAVESLEFVANAETEETEKQMATPGSDREREARILHGAEAIECKFRAEENGTVVVDLLTVEKPRVEKPVVPVGPNVDSHGAETEKSTVATVKVLEQHPLPSLVDEKMPLEMPKVEDQLNEVVQTHNLLYLMLLASSISSYVFLMELIFWLF